MEQAELDKKVGAWYEQIQLPFKSFGSSFVKSRLELHILEQTYRTQPAELDSVQLKRLASLHRMLGRVRVELGVLLPLYTYEVVQMEGLMQEPSIAWRIPAYAVVGCMGVGGTLFALLGLSEFYAARSVETYRGARQEQDLAASF